jgi:integrase
LFEIISLNQPPVYQKVCSVLPGPCRRRPGRRTFRLPGRYRALQGCPPLLNSKFNPHAWRHAFAQLATINGIPTVTLQKIMGHETIETTTIYAQPDMKIVKAAHAEYSPVNNLEIDFFVKSL